LPLVSCQLSARSQWQNGYAERLIGSIRRECVDHVVVLGERHLRHLLLSYMKYYNETHRHLSLNKDAPISRAVEAVGAFSVYRAWADCIITTAGLVYDRHTASILTCGEGNGSHDVPC